MQIVKAGRMTLLTDDPIVIALARRCADLEEKLRAAQHHEVARYRTLRRDVSQIRKAVLSLRAGSVKEDPRHDP